MASVTEIENKIMERWGSNPKEKAFLAKMIAGGIPKSLDLIETDKKHKTGDFSIIWLQVASKKIGKYLVEMHVRPNRTHTGFTAIVGVTGYNNFVFNSISGKLGNTETLLAFACEWYDSIKTVRHVEQLPNNVQEF